VLEIEALVEPVENGRGFTLTTKNGLDFGVHPTPQWFLDRLQ